ncbi:putative reverse transcriptase domain-containing protein [Tanacetum coccineum]
MCYENHSKVCHLALLLGAALTWCNGPDKNLMSQRGISMTCEVLKKKIRNKYFRKKQPWSPIATLQEAECRQSLQQWDKRKKPLWGDSLPSTPSVISTTMALCPIKCHKCNKIRHIARDCRNLDNFHERFVLKLKNKMEEMGLHNAGLRKIEKQKRGEMSP